MVLNIGISAAAQEGMRSTFIHGLLGIKKKTTPMETQIPSTEKSKEEDVKVSNKSLQSSNIESSNLVFSSN